VHIPHTPIRLGGLLLGSLIITVLIFFNKTLMALYPALSLWKHVLIGTVVCFIAESVFQLVRVLFFVGDMGLGESKLFFEECYLRYLLSLVLSFFVSFQVQQQVINELHGDNKLAFDYDGQTIAFGKIVIAGTWRSWGEQRMIKPVL
jgi:hypothetical protein